MSDDAGQVMNAEYNQAVERIVLVAPHLARISELKHLLREVSRPNDKALTERIKVLEDALRKCRQDYIGAYNVCIVSQVDLGINDAKYRELKAKAPMIKHMVDEISFALSDTAGSEGQGVEDA